MTNGNEPITATKRYFEGKEVGNGHSGLTKREFFAAQLMSMEVLPSEIANEQRRDAALNPHNTFDKPAPRSVDQIIADRAVRRADALIEALNVQEAKDATA